MRFFENLSVKAKRNIIVCVGLCVSLIMLSGSKGIETKTSQSKIEDILLRAGAHLDLKLMKEKMLSILIWKIL